jgi:hypothetical protein
MQGDGIEAARKDDECSHGKAPCFDRVGCDRVGPTPTIRSPYQRALNRPARDGRSKDGIIAVNQTRRPFREGCQSPLKTGPCPKRDASSRSKDVSGVDGSTREDRRRPLPIIAGFFAGLGRYRSARSQSPVRSLHRPSPTHNAAISRVRNITSQQDKP